MATQGLGGASHSWTPPTHHQRWSSLMSTGCPQQSCASSATAGAALRAPARRHHGRCRPNALILRSFCNLTNPLPQQDNPCTRNPDTLMRQCHKQQTLNNLTRKPSEDDGGFAAAIAQLLGAQAAVQNRRSPDADGAVVGAREHLARRDREHAHCILVPLALPAPKQAAPRALRQR